MKITRLTPDMMPSVVKLAREVEPIFESLMAEDQGFHEFIYRKIAQHEALIVPDEEQTGNLKGLIAFSHHNNAISWFAVFEKYQGQGIGSELLAQALRELDETKEISVTTFRTDNMDGIPARKVYQKFGFKDFDTEYLHDGHPRSVMKRPAKM